MAAVIVAPHHRPTPGFRPAHPRPPLQVIPGGRRGARARNAVQRAPGRLHPAVYRRRRLAAVVLVLTGVAVAWLAVLGLQSLVAPGSVAAPAPVAEVPVPSGLAVDAGADAADVYVVQSGDTLWSIARSLRPSGDIRPLVDQLAHRVGGGPLVAGQAVRLDGLAA